MGVWHEALLCGALACCESCGFFPPAGRTGRRVPVRAKSFDGCHSEPTPSVKESWRTEALAGLPRRCCIKNASVWPKTPHTPLPQVGHVAFERVEACFRHCGFGLMPAGNPATQKSQSALHGSRRPSRAPQHALRGIFTSRSALPCHSAHPKVPSMLCEFRVGPS